MDLLLISYDDTCRSRLAQALLGSFGRGMKIFTAGVVEGNGLVPLFRNYMDENGLDFSNKKPMAASTYAGQQWDVVITLCAEAEKAADSLSLQAKLRKAFRFDDPFSSRGRSEEDTLDELTKLHEKMYRELYRFYRDELSDLLMPRCTCGANTYCRCE